MNESCREVDALVSKAHGLVAFRNFTGAWWENTAGEENPARQLPFYSTDQETALSLAEKHRLALIPLEDGRWSAFRCNGANTDDWIEEEIRPEYSASTPMLAICRAILRNADVEIPTHLLPLFESSAPHQEKGE